MITLKAYAEANGISYEAVRQSIKRYKDKLEGHIVKIHRTQHLDDFAVAFLDEHRAQNPVVLYSEGTVRQLKEMEAANKKLDDKNRELLQELRALERWRADHAELIADAKQVRLALAAAQDAKGKLESTVSAQTAQIATLTRDKDEAVQKATTATSDAQAARGELAATQDKLAAARERERLLREYAIAMDAWSALGWWQRRRTPKPVMPEQSADGTQN